MNRYFRRMARFGRRFTDRRSPADTAARPPRRDEPGTPQDVSSVRAKSNQHGKVTADKWNQ
jgi:hypothetical protein